MQTACYERKVSGSRAGVPRNADNPGPGFRRNENDKQALLGFDRPKMFASHPHDDEKEAEIKNRK
jgi:hypothetical protein